VAITLVPFIFILLQRGIGGGQALEDGAIGRTLLRIPSTIRHGRGAVFTADRQTVYRLAINPALRPVSPHVAGFGREWAIAMAAVVGAA
jgi:hypothetical protein